MRHGLVQRASRTFGRYSHFHQGRVEFMRFAPSYVDCLGAEGQFTRVRRYIDVACRAIDGGSLDGNLPVGWKGHAGMTLEQLLQGSFIVPDQTRRVRSDESRNGQSAGAAARLPADALWLVNSRVDRRSAVTLKSSACMVAFSR